MKSSFGVQGIDPWQGHHRSSKMKAFTGWAMTAGLLLAATAANAQSAAPQQAGSARYQPAADVEGPYADVPPPPPVITAPNYGPRAYGPPPPYGPGPAEYGPAYGGAPLLPPTEVYAVLRENGFSPLGAPRLRGLFYSVSAIDRRGDDGRLVIDARDGRIVRFVPAEHFGYGGGYGGYGDGYYGGAPRPSYGGPLEPMTRLESPPRPQASVPKMASRMPQSVPMPKAAPSKSTDRLTDVKPSDMKPSEGRPLADKLSPATAAAPMQQSAAIQAKPADAPPAVAASAAVKPAAPAIQPTQPMPKVQDFE
jgi:hypothetical protein